MVLKIEFENSLNTVRTNDARHADVDVFKTILAGQMAGRWKQSTAVVEDRFCHDGGRRPRRVKSRTLLQQGNDFTTTLGGTF